MSREKTLKDLEEIFSFGFVSMGTGEVLNRPSKLDGDRVREIVDTMPLDGFMRWAGSFAAQEFAKEAEKSMIKPSQFADFPDIPKRIAERISGAIGQSEEFVRSFTEQLRSRG